MIGDILLIINLTVIVIKLFRRICFSLESHKESHEEFEKYKPIISSFKNIEIKDVDETLYLYMKDYNKKYNQYLLKGQFKLVFKNQDCKFLKTDMINNTTNISLSNYIREAIEECDFSHIAEMDIIILALKRDMTYDFYLKPNMSAFEWKINQLINKDKNLTNKLPCDWRHPINNNFNCYRNKII